MNSPEQYAALSNVRYSGSARRTMDSQEQYEALLSSWGFATKKAPKANPLKPVIARAYKLLKKTIKTSFDSITATAPVAKSQL